MLKAAGFVGMTLIALAPLHPPLLVIGLIIIGMVALGNLYRNETETEKTILEKVRQSSFFKSSETRKIRDPNDSAHSTETHCGTAEVASFCVS